MDVPNVVLSLRFWETHELVYQSVLNQFSFLSKTVLNILLKPQNVEFINTMTISSGKNEHCKYI